MPDASHYYADKKAPICPMEIKTHFDGLTHDQQRYAYHIGRASWIGARVVLVQTTPNSSDLYDMVCAVFSSAEDPRKLTDLDALRKASGVSEDEFAGVLEYSCQFLCNLGNFKTFGDVIFIPRVSVEVFRKVVAASPRAKDAQPLFDRLAEHIYSIDPSPSTLLGYPDLGHVTGYYSQDVTQADIKCVQEWLESRSMDPLNTRLFKRSDGVFELRIASAEKREPEQHKLSCCTLELVYGDYATEMAAVAEELKKAIPFAANDRQRKMLEHYVKHFETGSLKEYEASQREWVRDTAPAVETNIGFVETYQDPAGVRGAWEGFTAVVNKEMTKKFAALVQKAPTFIPLLPWGAAFEKDEFLKPDFTALEVLHFATGGVPAGINLPNLDSIRQDFGFKNVSLSNVLNAKAPNEKITFLSKEDAALMERLRGPAFEVQVGIHELLGHGTGKLLQVDRDGKPNFDKKTINPLTGKPVEHWYAAGETWGSCFKSIAASYEECRAEAVAMFLSLEKDLLALFGHTDSSDKEGTADDIIYIGWLNMCRAGLLGLEFYDPVAKKWGQAHMQARHAITRALLDAGEGLVTIENVGDNDMKITLDRSKIESVGKPAMGKFLTELQVYKSTADYEGGKAFYDKYTTVPDDWLPRRDIVLANRQPRKLFLQANTFLDGEKVVLKEYSADQAGLITSFLERDI